MNCKELKNLISEAEDLAAIGQTPAAGTHLKTCADCRANLAFEEKVRQGFAAIACEAAPPDLAAKIMAIQAENIAPAEIQKGDPEADSWLDRLLLSLQSFPLKVAFTAGLIGFLSAVLMLRQPQTTPVREPTSLASGQQQETPLPAQDEELLLAKAKDKGLQIQPEISTVSGIPAGNEDENTGRDSMQMAMAPRQRHLESKSEAAIESYNEERIPGAITFTLDSSADTFVADREASAATLADQPAASEAEMQLAMAPAATSRFAAPPPDGEARPRLAASQVTSQGAAKKMKTMQSEAIDPSGEELRELIESSGIDLPEGFINLDELAMRGYLPSERLKHLRPASGNGWYLQKSGNKLRVFLKKR
ncbi:MAG: hypothetical protein CVV42_10275 [Candidatus Riflebacteria bacterium HGW-Riflebacteria-2]|jgi:hypothetical protein|nr:MAG: hypothetical protein CVV42_10275 [Candidatus Riflebacteria bacterium HGW-Riflebacteria-2]